MEKVNASLKKVNAVSFKKSKLLPVNKNKKTVAASH